MNNVNFYVKPKRFVQRCGCNRFSKSLCESWECPNPTLSRLDHLLGACRKIPDDPCSATGVANLLFGKAAGIYDEIQELLSMTPAQLIEDTGKPATCYRFEEQAVAHRVKTLVVRMASNYDRRINVRLREQDTKLL